ncbi:MAG: VOC family protein [Bacteroidota bacterium]|nr:VOC family protein [Bacteroidota bacterium]
MKFSIPVIIVSVVMMTALSTLKAQEATQIKRPRIKGVAHIGLYVKDVENSRKFYKDFLGFAEPYSLKSADGSKLALTYIKINDRQVIELFPEKAANTNRLYHFAVETDDAEGMRLYLASKGCKVPATTPVGRTGNLNYFVTDPNGTICEIVQYDKEGYTMKNVGKDLLPTRISKRMSHVGFMVPDLDKAMKFYCDILGFKETWRGSKDGKNVSWVNLKVPEGNDYIELMLYDKEPSAATRGSMNHICLEIDDITKTLNTLKQRTLPDGCKMPSEFKIGINQKRQINCFDGDGTRVEIMEASTVDGKPVPSSPLPPLKFVPAETNQSN